MLLKNPLKTEENLWETGAAALTEAPLAPACLAMLMKLPAPEATEAPFSGSGALEGLP